eukprot:TRINITY_DN7190_c0_g1_i2.p1 TRINITY_DN7190_c0_g1~~TRINITY_DN7190_c0_g1_i2.p1  ORF type:complete len:1856 (-),score=344.01 TRINITY_DN7190_c0_g1_i2:155-5722(-)
MGRRAKKTAPRCRSDAPLILPESLSSPVIHNKDLDSFVDQFMKATLTDEQNSLLKSIAQHFHNAPQAEETIKDANSCLSLFASVIFQRQERPKASMRQLYHAIDAALRHEPTFLNNHLDHFFREEAIQKPDVAHVRALSNLTELEAGYLILAKHLPQAMTLAKAVYFNLLSVVAQEEYSPETAPSEDDVVDCHETAKFVVSVCGRFRGQLSNVYFQGGNQENTVSFLRGFIELFVKTIHSENLPKECYVSAGMAIFSIINLHPSPNHELPKLIWECFDFEHKNGQDSLLFLQERFSKVLDSMPQFGFIACLQGALTAVDLEFIDYHDESTNQYLVEILLQRVVGILQTSIEPLCRHAILMVLKRWIQLVIDLCSAKSSDFRDKFSFKIPSIVDKLLGYVWEFWEDPVLGIANEVKDLFELSMELLKFSEISSDVMDSLSSKLIEMDWFRRGKYGPLSSLVRHSKAGKLLDLSPGFLRNMLKALEEQNLHVFITDFFFNICRQLLQEVPLEEPAHKYWIEVFDALIFAGTHPDHRIREGILNSVMPTIIKVHPSFVTSLLQQVNERAKTNATECGNFRIGILRTARALGKMSLNENQKLLGDTINSALTHFDESIRLSAWDLVLSNPKTTELPSKFELDMLYTHLPVVCKSFCAGFRQSIIAIIKRFLHRYRTSLATYYKRAISWLNKQKQTNSTIDVVAGIANDETLASSINFHRWFLLELQGMLNPSAIFQRKTIALDIYKILIDVWTDPQMTEVEIDLKRFMNLDLFSADWLETVLICFRDTWDTLRSQSNDLLLRFPCPFPNYGTPESLQPLIDRAVSQLMTPRSRDSDPGALFLRLVFTKYVREAFWKFTLVDQRIIVTGEQYETRNQAEAAFISLFIDLFENSMKAVNADFQADCAKSPFHGTMHLLRLLVEELDFPNLKGRDFIQTKDLLKRLVSLLDASTDLVLWVISDSAVIESEDTEMDAEAEDENLLDVAPNQVFRLTCWLVAKEINMLLGSLAKRVPMYSPRENRIPYFTLDEFQQIGDRIQHILLSARHNGVIDKAYISLNEYCQRLLSSEIPEARAFPSQWLEKSIDALYKETYVLRRSAGIPFSFLAILRAEPGHLPPVLLHYVMKRLLSIVRGEDEKATEKCKVHALNTMKAIYRDKMLSSDSLKYISEGLMIAIQGFTSSSWSIRNSCTMCYTTIIARIFRNKKVRDEHSVRNGITGAEFFAKFHPLYDFLLDQLRVATSSPMTKQRAGDLGGYVHPTLYQVLLLLSKLIPSAVETNSRHPLSAYIPYVNMCTNQVNYKVRYMAARALAPLLPTSAVMEYLEKQVLQLVDHGKEWSSNNCHGVVLQISEIIAVHLGLMSRDEQKGFLNSVCGLLIRILPVMALFKQSNMIQYTFLQIAAKSLSPYFSQSDSVLSKYGLFDEFNAKIWDYVKELLERPYQPYEPAVFELRKVSAAVFVDSLLRNVSRDTSLVSKYLSDESSVVRATTAKVISRKARDGNISHDILAEPLVSQFKVETDMKCLKRLANAICDVLANTKMNEQEASLFSSLATYLVQGYQTQTRLQGEYVIPLIGSLFGRVRDLISCPTTELLSLWIDVLESHSHPEKIVTSREACMQSLLNAKLPRGFALQDEDTNVHLLIILSRLLLDDDEDIRELAAGLSIHLLNLDSAQVPERAIEVLYDHLSKKHHTSTRYLEHLVAHLDVGEEPVPTEAGEHGIDFFPEEKPNLYVEDTFMAHASARNLAKCIATSPSSIHAESVARHLANIYNKLSDTSSLIARHKLTSPFAWAPMSDIYEYLTKLLMSYFAMEELYSLEQKAALQEPLKTLLSLAPVFKSIKMDASSGSVEYESKKTYLLTPRA